MVRKVGKDASRCQARQKAKDRRIVLVRDFYQNVSHVGRVEREQVVAESIPALLPDQLLDGGTEQATKAGHEHFPWGEFDRFEERQVSLGVRHEITYLPY